MNDRRLILPSLSLVLLGLEACGEKAAAPIAPAAVVAARSATPAAPHSQGAGGTLPGTDAAFPRGDATAASAARAPLRSVDIMDPAGFGAPMLAATAQIPGDWETRGGIGWDRSSDCVTNHLRVKWYAGSRDQRHAFEMLPGMTWQVQGTEVQMNPCPTLPMRKARDLLHIVAQRFPNARELDYRDRPDLAQQSGGAASQQGSRASADGGQLLIAYREGDQEMRALLTTTVTITEAQGNIVVGSPAVYALHAPDGQLDFALGDQIMRSIKPTAQWVQSMQRTSMAAVDQIAQRQSQAIASWHAGEMGRSNAKGAAERSQIALQTSRDVAQIYSNTWSNSQKTDDVIQRRTLEAIGSYNTYADPAAGNDVRGSIDYNRVLRTDGGDYIGTDDPNYNPAGTQELQRVP